MKTNISTQEVMYSVTLSLVPAGIASVFIFGTRCLFVMIVSILAAVISEALILAVKQRDISPVYDGSALLTGLLLAYCLPPEVPLWLAAAGSVFAIAVAKQAFGGLGRNIFNPALAGRAFLMLLWPAYMILWQNPRWQVDTVTSATPLVLHKYNKLVLLSKVSLVDLFLGNRGGSIGEVCVIALLIGASYLLIKRYITWHVPITYIMSVGILSWAFNGRSGLFSGDAFFFILSGGLILGAFFMATDHVTSPWSAGGKVIFGIGCGVLTFMIRKFTNYPEGVCYAILIMNGMTYLIGRSRFLKRLTRMFIIACVMAAPLLIALQQAWPETNDASALKALVPEADSFRAGSADGIEYFEALRGGRLAGYCVRAEAAGYCGAIKMLVAVDTSGAIKGIKVLEHRETAGIGAKVTQAGFLKQFEGKTDAEVSAKKGIDTVTGATISSEAVIEAVSRTIGKFLSNHPPELGEKEEVRQ